MRRTLATVSLLAMAAAMPAGAQEFDLSVSVGVTHSDNVGRTSTAEESETMPEAGIRLNVERQGRLTSTVAADLVYRSYGDDTFDDELVGGLDAAFVYAFVPERFNWTVQNNFGQSFIDRGSVETPDNRQNLNYFSTGPDFVIPLGSRSRLLIAGRWSDVGYEESDLDSERLLGGLSLVRDLAGGGALSVNASAMRVEFDDSPPNSDYDLQSAYLAYRAAGTRTDIELRAGYTALHDFNDTQDAPLASLTLSRKLSPRTTLSFSAGTELNDAADSFRRDRQFAGIGRGGANVSPSADLFQQDFVAVSWAFSAERTELEVTADWRREDYETELSLDRDRFGVDVQIRRRIGPRLTGSVFGSYGDEEFDNASIEFDEYHFGLGLEWRFSPNYGLSLAATRYDGSGDTSAGIGLRDYDETRYTIRFTYSTGRQ